jgi:hypothetical protein
MQTYVPTTKKLFGGIIAVAAVVAANLLAAESAIPSAPEAITGIGAPSVSATASFEDHEFVVPVMRRGELTLPTPPDIDVEAVRNEASAWLGNGAIAAPTASIDVVAPEVSRDAEPLALDLDVPELERPELPTLPKIR